MEYFCCNSWHDKVTEWQSGSCNECHICLGPSYDWWYRVSLCDYNMLIHEHSSAGELTSLWRGRRVRMWLPHECTTPCLHGLHTSALPLVWRVFLWISYTSDLTVKNFCWRKRQLVGTWIHIPEPYLLVLGLLLKPTYLRNVFF